MSLSNWMSKFTGGLLRAREGGIPQSCVSPAPDSAAPPQKEAPAPSSACWTTPDGSPMHARWKGLNAVVWWPLKDQELAVSVESFEKNSVTCRSGQAEYNFWRLELEKFVSHAELTESKMSKREAGSPGSLHVNVRDYKIVGAELVHERERERKKGIA